MSRAPSIQVYGAGRVGLAIARLAVERGLPLAGLWNPRPLRPARAALAEDLPLTVGARPPAVEAEIWILAVPDDAIAGLAGALAVAATAGPRPAVAAHCAGAHPGRLLAPLEELGVACGSWHPAMTFRGGPGDDRALAGAWAAVEGPRAAREPLERLADALGMRRFVLAAEGKPRYHAALVLASNGRVALDAVARRLLADAGLEDEAARGLLAPLIARTDENLAASPATAALTGPVARGDARTVRSQIESLGDRPAALALYRALGAVALDLVPDGVRGEGHREVARLLDTGPNDGEER